ncbi:MAG: hypothetical protein AB1791_04630 [Chloroflexota bacterium]
MDVDALYQQHQASLEDFWGRRENGPRFTQTIHLFGRPFLLTSNDEGVLAAADFSLPLYSTAPATNHSPFSIHLVVRPIPTAPGPAPDDIFEQIQYSGYGDWLTLHLSQWGHCFVDLSDGRAIAVLSPELAVRPEVVSRCLLNTLFNNFFKASGYGMLHATGLWRDGRALLLMAPHNSGKSTTALRLVMAGYALLSDSQIYVDPDSQRLRLFGFPVGKGKLRQDVLPHFPQLQPFLQTELVRGEVKYGVDLRRFDPCRVQAAAVEPAAVELCLLANNGSNHTHLVPATEDEAMAAVMVNSMFYDTAEAWRRNLRPVERLLRVARCHHLVIGSEPDGIVAAVNSLWL